MEPETELDAVLIDAFDAEPVPLRSLRIEDTLPRRKRQSDSAFRGVYNADATVTSAPAAIVSSLDGAAPMLRHYPSLDALSPAPPGPSRPSPPVTGVRRTSYPRLDPVMRMPPPPFKQSVGEDGGQYLHRSDSNKPQSEAPPVISNRTSHSAPPHASIVLPSNTPTHEGVRITQTLQQPVVEREYVHPSMVSKPKGEASLETISNRGDPTVAPTPSQPKTTVHNAAPILPIDTAIPTDDEIEHQRRQLEAEVHHFALQADYMALALAGDTPHQLEMRRQREQERKARDERRVAAVEARSEHMVERELQREARHDERRQRHAERTHRSSVSPSPERESNEPKERGDEHVGGTTVET